MTPHHLDGTDAVCPASQGAHICQGAHVGILGARHRVDTGKIATVKVKMPSQVNVVVAPGRDWKQHLSTFYEDQKRPPAAHRINDYSIKYRNVEGTVVSISMLAVRWRKMV